MTQYTRRTFCQTIAAAVPVVMASGATINSKFGGVQVGAITYSLRAIPADQIIPGLVKAGVGEIELMSNHCEALANAPRVGRGPGGKGQDPGDAETLRKWRMSATADTFKPVRKKFNDAGIDVHLLTYNLGRDATDDEIEYSFTMAKSLGVKAITCSTRIAVARRVAPFADKHKLLWAAHGHDNTSDPEEVSSPETFATVMSLGKYMGVNLDIGHFTAANYDPIAYIKEHHARISNLHLKDRKKNHGANLPWGEGETPIKEVLQLLKKEKYPIPANVEYEYMGKDDPVTEVGRCIQYCKQALA